MAPSRRAVGLGLAGAALMSGTAMVDAADPQVRLVLGTATPGGGFPVYGEAFIGAIGAVDPTLAIEARNTAGSTENIPLLEAGKLDLGLVQGEPAFAALSGGSPLRVVTAMYSTAGLFVVRADSNVRTIADLRGQTVALGARGSGLTILGRIVLEALGIDPDRDIQAITLERAGDGPAMVLDGRVAALWGGGAGWPGFTAVAASPQGARFISPSGPEIDRILARNPNLRRLVVPAGTYRGQDAAIESVGSWSLVLARPDLDEALGYRLARGLDRGRSEIAGRLPAAAETTPANTAAAVPPAWLNPGVARYLREAGTLKP